MKGMIGLSGTTRLVPLRVIFCPDAGTSAPLNFTLLPPKGIGNWDSGDAPRILQLTNSGCVPRIPPMINLLNPIVWAEIGVFVKGLAVLIEKLDADLWPNQALFHFLLNQLFHAPLQVIRKILNNGQNLLHRSPLDYFFDEVIVGLIGVGVHVDFRNTAEKIMNVTQDVLICAHEKETHIIWLSFYKAEHMERILRAQRRHKSIDFSVGIAGEIDQCSDARRLLVEPMDRHNGKHLADRPVIQYGLENREVAKILVSKLFLHEDQVLGKQLRISLLQHPVDRRAYRPIEPFSGSLLFQRKIAQLEQEPNLLPFLCSVVEHFQQHGQGFPPYRLVCNRIE